MVPRNACIGKLKLVRQLISTMSLPWISLEAQRHAYRHKQRLTLLRHASLDYMRIIVRMLHQCMASYITFLHPESSRPNPSCRHRPIFRLHIPLGKRDRPVIMIGQGCRWQLSENPFNALQSGYSAAIALLRCRDSTLERHISGLETRLRSTSADIEGLRAMMDAVASSQQHLRRASASPTHQPTHQNAQCQSGHISSSSALRTHSACDRQPSMSPSTFVRSR